MTQALWYIAQISKRALRLRHLAMLSLGGKLLQLCVIKQKPRNIVFLDQKEQIRIRN